MRMRNIQNLLRSRDHVAIALDTLARLEPVPEIDKHGEDRGWSGMYPSAVCGVPRVSDRIRFGRAEGLNDVERAEHETWLAAATSRSFAMSENERKLRALMWAELVLRNAEQHEPAQALRNFMFEQWGVGEEIPAQKTRAESRIDPEARCPFEALLWRSVRRNADWQNDERQQYRHAPNQRENRANV
jgi:hypothetical protein